MGVIWRVIKELMFRIYLFFLGIHFCELDRIDEPLAETVIIPIGRLYEITFQCYRKTITEFLFIRGRIDIVTYYGYFLQVSYSENAPDKLKATANKTLYFNGGVNRFGTDEETTLVMLVDIYLDYLKKCVWGKEA